MRRNASFLAVTLAAVMLLAPPAFADDDSSGDNHADATVGRDGQTGTDATTNQDAQAGMDATVEPDGSIQDAGPPPHNECEDWQNRHPEWLWCDGFEDGQALGDKYPDIGSTGMDVSTDDAYAGSHSLKQHYDEGQVSAGWVSFFYGDTLGHDYGPVQQTIYMRWYHKFEDGFDGFPPKMARVTSIGPNWDKRFGVHFWIQNGEIVADVHAPYSSQANDVGWLAVKHSGFFFTDAQNVGRWICFEMMVRANTPGQTDGAYVFWADGQEILRADDVDLVGDTDYHFNNAMLDCYWNDGSPKAQNRYYDNFVVSTERIGCN